MALRWSGSMGCSMGSSAGGCCGSSAYKGAAPSMIVFLSICACFSRTAAGFGIPRIPKPAVAQ
eukprot:2220172-Prymnesium_polylepis.1